MLLYRQYPEKTTVNAMSKIIQLRKYAKNNGTPGPKKAN